MADISLSSYGHCSEGGEVGYGATPSPTIGRPLDSHADAEFDGQYMSGNKLCRCYLYCYLLKQKDLAVSS